MNVRADRTGRRITDRLGKAAPGYVLSLLAMTGVGGGYVVKTAAAAVDQASVTQREVDKAVVQRNRYEDLLERCTNRRIDDMAGRKP